MQNLSRIVLYVLLGVVLVHLLFDIFGSGSNIKSIIQKVEKAQEKVDSSLSQINTARQQLDSIQQDVNRFRLYIRDIQSHVELSDVEKKLKESGVKKVRDSLVNRINEIKQDLLVTDTLPDIPIN